MEGMFILSTIHSILTKLKGFEAGQSTGVKDKIVVHYGGKCYLLKIEELPQLDITEKDLSKNRALTREQVEIFKHLNYLKED